MSTRGFSLLEAIIIVASVILGEYVTRGLVLYVSDQASQDTGAIVYSLLAWFVVRPIFANICGVLGLILGWQAINRLLPPPKASRSPENAEPKPDIRLVVLTITFVSVLWSGLEVFLTHEFWP